MLHKYKLVIGCPIMELLSYRQNLSALTEGAEDLPFTRSCHGTWQVQPPQEWVCSNTGESHPPLEERCSDPSLMQVEFTAAREERSGSENIHK